MMADEVDPAPEARPVSEPDDKSSGHLTKLVSVTPDAEKTILYCARVSSDQSNEDDKLIGYLIRNNHWSPFELASMTVEINTSRAIAPQILRHRSFSFQEFSQRYAVAGGTVKYRARRQAVKNRQSSTDDLPAVDQHWFLQAQAYIEKEATRLYREALEREIAKESARFLLPAATETKLYMSGTVRSWIHYLQLRTDEHTQQEHREIALEIRDRIFYWQFPVISMALGWRGTTSM